MKKISFAAALVVVNWIAAGGLFVSSQLIMPRRGILPAERLDEILFDTPMSERPESSFWSFGQTAKINDDGLFQIPSKEDIKEVAKDWGQYALKLEASLDLARSSVQRRRALIARISTLFWIAFGLVTINAVWSAAYVLGLVGRDHNDKRSGGVTPST